MSAARVMLIVAILLATAGVSGCQTHGSRGAADPAAVEWTFLKAKPGKREALRQFILTNWFAMDERAVREGLMRSYRLLDSGNEEGPWDLAVEVEYFDARGYEGIKQRFAAIRSEHIVRPVNGQLMPDLGSVVGSRRLFPVASGGAAAAGGVVPTL